MSGFVKSTVTWQNISDAFIFVNILFIDSYIHVRFPCVLQGLYYLSEVVAVTDQKKGL